MDKILRSIVWILVILVLLSSFSSVWFFVTKEKLYNDYINLENLFKINMERLNTELTASKKEKIELEARLDEIQKQINVLEANNSELKTKYEDASKEKDYLTKELASVKNAKVFLEKKLKSVESDMYVAGLLKEKVALDVELNRLKDTLMPKDVEIERLKTENMDLNVRVSKLQEDRNAIEQKLKDATAVAEILSSDLLKERNMNEGQRQWFEKARLENNVLQNKVLAFEDLSREYNNLLAEKEDARTRIAQLEKNLAYKDEELKRFRIALENNAKDRNEFRAEAYHTQEEVDLPPIVLNSERETPQKVARFTTPSFDRIGQRTDLQGKVLTVNREHNFVVIDLGKQDGIEIGNMFNVYRDRLLLGAVEVIQIRDRISAADIKNVKEGLSIEVDDMVVKR